MSPAPFQSPSCSRWLWLSLLTADLQWALELMWQYTCLQHPARGRVTHRQSMPPEQLASLAVARLLRQGGWKISLSPQSHSHNLLRQHLAYRASTEQPGS